MTYSTLEPSNSIARCIDQLAALLRRRAGAPRAWRPLHDVAARAVVCARAARRRHARRAGAAGSGADRGRRAGRGAVVDRHARLQARVRRGGPEHQRGAQLAARGPSRCCTPGCSPPPRASSATPAARPSASAELDAALASASLPADLRARLLCRRAIAVESDDPLAASEVAVAACREFGTAAGISSRRCSACRPATASSPTARARCAPPAKPRRSREDSNDRVAADLADLATGTALALVGRPAEALALVTLLDRRVPPGGRIAMNTTVARADTALACGDFHGRPGGLLPLAAHPPRPELLRQRGLPARRRRHGPDRAGALRGGRHRRRDQRSAARANARSTPHPSTASPATPTSPAPTEPSAQPASSSARATARRLGVHHGPLWVASHVDPAPTIQPSGSGAPPPIPANRG